MSIEIRPDNTLRAHIPELTREDTGAALRDVDLDEVTCTIFSTDGTELASATLTDQGEGEWSGLINSDHGIEDGKRVDVRFKADGAPTLTGTWWRRQVKVQERPVP